MIHATGTQAFGPAASLRRLAITSSWVVLLFCNHARAEPPPAFDFKIAPQAMASALVEFSQQAEVQVVGATAAIGTIRTGGVNGHFTGAEALERLLHGTELAARWKGLHTVTIAPAVKISEFTAVRFDIQARNLDEALTEFGLQSGLKVAASTDLTMGKRSKAVRGTMPAPDALRRLLKGSGLTFVHGGDGGFTIEVASVVGSANAVDAEGPVSADVSVQSDRAKQLAFIDGNMDIARTIDDVQPYYFIDSETIAASGATNVEELLKQQLSMNTSVQSTSQQIVNPSIQGNTSSINLRGLGADHTLILVNGRRVAGVTGFASDGTYQAGQPDLNGIPLSAIDHIEILPTSAAGIYGASALGGVINIILKRNYKGGEVLASFDDSVSGSSPIRTLSATYGSGFNDGNTNIMVSATWSDAKTLDLQDRKQFLERGLGNIMRNDSGFLYDTANTPFLGSLPNIIPDYYCSAAGCTAAPTTLTLRNGTPLNSAVTHIPSGTSSSTSLAALNAGLLANAGVYDFTLPATAQNPTGLYRSIGVTPTTKSFMIDFRQKVSSIIELVLDGAHNENDSSIPRYSAGPGNVGPFSAVVPATAPTNPFNSAVQITLPSNASSRFVSNSTTDSLTAGVIAHLPNRWTGEADYTWSRNRLFSRLEQFDQYAFTNDINDGAYNPFVDALQFPPETAKYFLPDTYHLASTLGDLSLHASGPLWTLPWGTPTLTVGLERRVGNQPPNRLSFVYPITTSADLDLTYFKQQEIATSVYAELELPLIQQDYVPLIHALELQVAGRSERDTVSSGTQTYYDYTNAPANNFYGGPTNNGQPFSSTSQYTSTNFTLGFKYQPVKEVTLRASIASAYLPPLPSQLIANPQVDPFPSQVVDPKTGGTVSVQTLSGGNPGLQPQSSRSRNAGIVWEPSWSPVDHLRLDLEYYKIAQFNAISTLGPQQIVDEAANFPGRVVRNASGTITLVKITDVNLFELQSNGWDFSVNYPLHTSIGDFDFRAAESIIVNLDTQYAQNGPEYNAVGYLYEGGAGKYKSNATLTWALRAWRAGWTTVYYGSYKQYCAPGSPTVAQGYCQSPNVLLLAQGSDTIPGQIYHDAFVRYTFGDDWKPSLLANLSLQFGMQNVFNHWPPYDTAYDFYTSPLGDIRLRSFRLTLKKAF